MVSIKIAGKNRFVKIKLKNTGCLAVGLLLLASFA